MDASVRGTEALQVSRLPWRFAGPTSGAVARYHSLLDLPRDRLALVSRLRNDADDVLQELPELHVLGRPVTAAAETKFPGYWQAVYRADLPSNRR